jgi:para-nitrobenzyl esterase
MDASMASLDEPRLALLAGRLLGPRSAEALSVYREARAKRGQATRPVALWTALMTDARFRMPAILTAQLHSQHTPDTWMYCFDYPSPALDGNLGACHSLDVPFVWGTLGSENMAAFCGSGPAVEALSARVMGSYLAFARHRDPATDALPAWPRYDASRRATMRLGLECAVAYAPMDEERAFWASLGAGFASGSV